MPSQGNFLQIHPAVLACFWKKPAPVLHLAPFPAGPMLSLPGRLAPSGARPGGETGTRLRAAPRRPGGREVAAAPRL